MNRSEIQVRVPGDKSITHRALILAALGDRRSRIRRPLIAADTRSTAAALRLLGVNVPEMSAGMDIAGAGLHGLRAARESIDCGNSGTTARLLMGVLAGFPFASTLTGDASLRSRPMRRVTEPLALMGATFEELEQPDRLPIRMHGGALRALRHHSARASAQVKSALLLAGLTGGAEVTVTEPVLSRDHTERMLSRVGVELRREEQADGSVSITLSPAARIDALDIHVPGDPSSAAFIAAWALLAAARPVRIVDVGLNPGRTGFFDVVRRMGASVSLENVRESCGEPIGDVVVRRSELHATSVAGPEIPSLIDEVPILAVLAAHAEGTTRIDGASELRVKESDRIRAIVDNLKRVGASAEELADGLIVHGAGNDYAGTVQVHADHRIAMAFGVLGAVTDGRVRVDDPHVADVSFPGFHELLHEMNSTAA